MSSRMLGLLALMALLLAARIFVPTTGDRPIPAVVAALDHAPKQRLPDAAPAATAPVPPGSTRAARLDADVDEPRNAFEVRLPPAPPKPVTPPRALAGDSSAVARPAVAAPPATVEPPSPILQVIGTWSDGQGPSVFVASAGRVVQLRVGDQWLSDYRVAGIDASQVLLRDLRANREIRLALPLPTTLAR